MSDQCTLQPIKSNRHKPHNASLDENDLGFIPNDHDFEETLDFEDTKINEAEPESKDIHLNKQPIINVPPSMEHAIASFTTMSNTNQDHSVEEHIIHANYFLNFE